MRITIPHKPKFNSLLVVFPPEPSTVHPALWLDDARIVMVHGPIHKAQVSIYNIKDRRFEKHVAASGLCTPLLLSHDKRTLIGVHCNGFSVCDLEGEAGCVHHRTAVWNKNGESGRFINWDEFFKLDLSKTGDARVFHSEQHRAQHAKLTTDGPLRYPKLGFPPMMTDGGEILVKHTHDTVDEQRKVRVYERGYYRIDPRNLKFRFHFDGVEDGRWLNYQVAEHNFSGNGQASLTYDRDTCLYSSGLHIPGENAFDVAIPEVVDHRDVQLDGAKRYGLMALMWDTAETPKLIKSILVRMSTAAELRRPNQDASRVQYADAALEFEMALRAHPNNAEVKTKEPKFFRASRLGGEPDTWFLAKHCGGIDPVFQLTSALGTFWQPDAKAFWVLFPDNCIRRIDTSGAIGPLLSFEGVSNRIWSPPFGMEFGKNDKAELSIGGLGSISFSIDLGVGPEIRRTARPEEFEFDPARDHRNLVKAAAENLFTSRIEITDLSANACIQGIQEAARRIDWQLDRMIVKNSLTFNFITPHETFDEKSFYSQVVDSGYAAAAALRALLNSYVARVGAGEGTNPWCDPQNGVAGLGYALRALVILDPNSLDVFRAYAAKRDGEHEVYCCRVLFPEYVARHGLKDEAAIRFGVYLTINQMWGGLTIDRVPFGLMEAAKVFVPPKRFYEILMQEIQAFNLKPQWSDQTKDWYRDEFSRMLDRTDSYQQAILATIVRKSHSGLMSRVLKLVSSLFSK